MADQFARTELLLGRENMEKLRRARVAVFGIGGVGGHAVEALARSGVGTLDLIDNDTVALSNLNRQLIATRSTLGMYKVDAAKARILDINPDAVVHTYRMFYLPETADQFRFEDYDYVVDAIDTVAGKLGLVSQAMEAGVPIISSMGAGNKVDAAAFEVADISKTSVCPLARVMRRELKKRGIDHLKVVYSKEKPRTPFYGGGVPGDGMGGGIAGGSGTAGGGAPEAKGTAGRLAPGSIAFVPSVAGLILAGEVIQDLTGVRGEY